jgi:hypothetical protein
VGKIFGGESVAREGWTHSSSRVGTSLFQRWSIFAYKSGIGGMKIEIVLTLFFGHIGRQPAYADISPHRRDLLRANHCRSDYFAVETEHLTPQFPLPIPRAWG